MIIQPPQGALQLQGRNISFMCTAFGIPRPSITWMFVGVDGTMDEPSSTNIKEIENVVTAELNITNIKPEEFGIYSCIATNMFNNDTEMALLEEGSKLCV